jgi:glycosyltransferase involved in cell wall biosynthesis
VLQVEPIGGHRGMHYYDFNLGKALVDQGVEVTLLTSDETDIPADLSFEARMTFRGIFGPGRAPSRGWRYVKALARLAARRPHPQGEVAHWHFFLVPPADYVLLRWMKRRGFKIVITAHDVVPFDRAPSALLGRLYGLADWIIVHAESNRQEMLDLFAIPAARITVIPHGNYIPNLGELPTQKAAKRRLGVDPDQPLLLFFGQIKRVKGLDHLLRALPLVLDQIPQAQLCIAGAVWKDDWSRYAALIDELGLRDHLLLHIGHVPDERVPDYFAAADAVVLPYNRVYQSGVLLMACSYGRPVVATAVGGMAETLRHGETGILVPPRDPATLAEAMVCMLADKETAEIMGRQAQAWVQAAYSWDTIAAKTKALYAELLDA